MAHERLDVAMIYADNHRSAELAIMAMRQGLHVIVEKPMASTLREADAMIAHVQQVRAAGGEVP